MRGFTIHALGSHFPRTRAKCVLDNAALPLYMLIVGTGLDLDDVDRNLHSFIRHPGLNPVTSSQGTAAQSAFKRSSDVGPS